MSFQAKRQLLAQIASRYREANRKEKRQILDEFVAATGYVRKYAIRLLGHPPPMADAIKRPRARRYGPAVQEALVVAWTATNCICAKRLVPFLPELVQSLEAHGHLALTDDVRTQLLAMSAATADRILSGYREQHRPRGASTTKAGKLLKHQVPIRTFADWEETQPGFFEVDLVDSPARVVEPDHVAISRLRRLGHLHQGSIHACNKHLDSPPFYGDSICCRPFLFTSFASLVEPINVTPRPGSDGSSG